jgi:hypothetical protein
MKFDNGFLKNSPLFWIILGFISFFAMVVFMYLIINLLYSMVEYVKC